ncbi:MULTISPECIES: hypothetical protein [Hyphomicrobiales]|jgi:hypothetical protein|uniref:Uncharacterized protein n=3 Tax=Brucella TaxID=234 RepID=A0A7X6FUP1_9HYPH|nr:MULTISPECIES: hypothetical protein [Brucella/Ochrobactrum group]MCR5944237.1 hypothetical protein [Ochrobactrum sp. XJ1]KAB2663301.1 hypothetical protein F9K91_18915 [Brucella tritici]MBB5704134.1 hypothetical protein [Brucella daejeonensis]NKB80226.1 hypothetical protein [Brucella daejeonensis]NKW11440.1 hypothetical protein [Brucella tritici]
MKNFIQYLQATGRSLRTFLAKIVSNFFRRGSIALKIAVKLPFFFEADLTVKTEWDRDQHR